MNQICDREDCSHEMKDHPDNGVCVKCDCIGFLRAVEVDNP